MSKHLGGTQLRGIEKVGGCLIPGDPELPSFAASGCVEAVDRILDFMPPADLSDLKLLLTLLGSMPRILVRVLLALLEWTPACRRFFPAWACSVSCGSGCAGS